VRAGMATLLVAGAALGVPWAEQVARAQDAALADLAALPRPVLPGLEAEPDEVAAWQQAESGRHIRARELAERVVAARPTSYVGHFVLGHVHLQGEANAPRALYELDQALSLYRARWGEEPGPDAPWRWHSLILRALVSVHGDLEHYEQQLAWMRRYNEPYDPDMVAEMAWPLMKLRRFDEARAVARRARSLPGFQEEIALNALCAIEFEAGDAEASYAACLEAMQLHGGDPAQQSAVDFTNFAEAAHSVFRLDEAERVGLLAAEAQTSWYGNPHVELGELYIREGRFVEALASLRQAAPYRQRRPPHVQDGDRNEARRALASFFLVIGWPADAARLTHRMVTAPDRRAHNSRDPAQDVAIAALLDRRALLMQAEQLRVEALGAPLHERIWAWARGLSMRLDAWRSGRQAARALADEERLVGTFMVGTSRSAVLPSWLAGELTQVLGAGVTREALRRARGEDRRPAAAAYYDAFEAEAALASGDPEAADRLARAALGRLEAAEALLRARCLAVAAEASRRAGEPRRALERYDEAFQVDPGVFLRLDFDVPVRFAARGGAVAAEVADVLARSPRLTVEDTGLLVEIEADAQHGRACLVGAGGSVLGCAQEAAQSGESAEAFAGRLAVAFHHAAFAPRIDLTRADATSLDGANTVSRDALDTLFSGDSGDLLDE